MKESEYEVLEDPERLWYLDNRFRALDHAVYQDVSKPLPFKTKKGKIDAIFPDELEAMQFQVVWSLFEDCDMQGEGLNAGRVVAEQIHYPLRTEDNA